MFWILSILFVIGGLLLLMSSFAAGKFGASARLIGGIIFVVGAITLLAAMIIIIPAGHVGVIYDPFAGGVQDGELSEGLTLVPPWQEVILYSMRTQSYNLHYGGDDIAVSALTAEGLTVSVDLTVLYHVQPGQASSIYQNIGKYYQEIVLKPIVRASVRDLISKYKAEDLYTEAKRVLIQNKLTSDVAEKLAEKGIEVESILIRDIVLPDKIMNAIEAKLESQQQAIMMEFVLEKEEQEAQRKIIEAQGIADSNEIISNSLTDSYLTWYWIQSLQQHESVIYVPVGDEGLPLFKEVD